MRLSKFKASPSKLVIKTYAAPLNNQTRVSGFRSIKSGAGYMYTIGLGVVVHHQ